MLSEKSFELIESNNIILLLYKDRFKKLYENFYYCILENIV